MSTVPEIVPISKLRHTQNEILAKLSEGPVVLTQHGEAAAVLVDPKQWNRLIEELEDLYDALDAIEARQEEGQPIDFHDYLASRGERVSTPSET